MIRPLFSFYGSKWRTAPHYPPPKHDLIIEPFAGSAGYSCRYPYKNVLLVERDPTIAALWRYLIAAQAVDIRALPSKINKEDLATLPNGPRALIGFWLNKGAATPRVSLSAWGRNSKYADQFWGDKIKERVAATVEKINHWRIIEGDYQAAPRFAIASWFIDPPYRIMGRHYKHGAAGIDYDHLGQWCRSLSGGVVVCENNNAAWLPFKPFITAKANAKTKKSFESIWTNFQPKQQGSTYE